MFSTNHRNPSSRRGAIVVLVALLIPIVVVLAAFAVDVAWMQLVRTELRTATDAAARAAAKELSLEQDIRDARRAGKRAARQNLVAGEPLLIRNRDVQFGSSTQSNSTQRFTFTPGADPVNGVRVTGARNAASRGGDVSLFFGGVLGTGDFEPVHQANSTVLDRDICLVIDRSGSMGLDINFAGTGNGQNCGPMAANTRFFALAQAIEAFLQELEDTYPEERVALASYSTNTSRSCPVNGNFSYSTSSLDQTLTDDYSRITSTMDDFLFRGIGGGTAIGRGLQEGIDSLEDARPFAIKTIVLMTDGRHNSGTSPETIAQNAVAADVVIHTITFSPNADINRMQTVAQIGGGQHFHADTAVDLAIIFQEIARTLPVLLTE